MERQSIIVDNGSYSVKGGYAADTKPRFVGPNGTARQQLRVLVSDELTAVMRTSTLGERSSPIEADILVDAGCQYAVWQRMFGVGLNINPDETNLLLAEQPLALQAQFDELIFEDFGFASVCKWPAPALAATGLGPAMVVDFGHEFTRICPVNYQSRSIATPEAVRRSRVGGRLLCGYLRELISYRNEDFIDDFNTAERMTHLFYIAHDFNKEQTLFDQEKIDTTEFILPDDTTISLGSERYVVPEVLFSPQDIGLPQAGIHDAISDSFLNCEQNFQLSMNHIVLCGAGAKLPGLEHRLESELRPLLPDYLNFLNDSHRSRPHMYCARSRIRRLSRRYRVGSPS